jgi:hypothetical protein
MLYNIFFSILGIGKVSNLSQLNINLWIEEMQLKV